MDLHIDTPKHNVLPKSCMFVVRVSYTNSIVHSVLHKNDFHLGRVLALTLGKVEEMLLVSSTLRLKSMGLLHLVHKNEFA